jgi:hypothetical protein
MSSGKNGVIKVFGYRLADALVVEKPRQRQRQLEAKAQRFVNADELSVPRSAEGSRWNLRRFRRFLSRRNADSSVAWRSTAA